MMLFQLRNVISSRFIAPPTMAPYANWAKYHGAIFLPLAIATVKKK